MSCQILEVQLQLSPLDLSLPYLRLSNKVLYEPLSQGVSEIRQVKVKSILIYFLKVDLSTLTCCIFKQRVTLATNSLSLEIVYVVIVILSPISTFSVT